MPSVIAERLLKQYGAKSVSYKKGETIFRQGETASDFHMVRYGRVKMVNVNEDGKEFVQGHFTDGQSFGEPPFFGQSPYPASAVAETSSEIWRVNRQNFLTLLRENFDVHLEITRILASRLLYKSMMLSELAIEESEHRVTTLLAYLRKTLGEKGKPYVLPFSRQQLADMCGLRVETVIRIVKNLEKKKVLRIMKRGKVELR